MAESQRPLIWSIAEEIPADPSSELFGNVHYFDEESQTLFVEDGNICTYTSEIQNGDWKNSKRSKKIIVGEGKFSEYGGIFYSELDHPSNGVLYMSSSYNDKILFMRYVYSMDVSNILKEWDWKMSADNPVCQFSAEIGNFDVDVFDSDNSLFEPGSKVSIKTFFGNDGSCQIGVGNIDSIDFSPDSEDISFNGRNLIGVLLKDQTFDDQTSYVGTASNVCKKMLQYAGVKKYVVQDLDRKEEYKIQATQSILDGITGVLNLCYNNSSSADIDNLAKVVEMPDGRVIVGLAKWLKTNGYLTNGYYTFNRGSDVFSRKLKKSIDACYTALRATGRKKDETTTEQIQTSGPSDVDLSTNFESIDDACAYFDFYRKDFEFIGWVAFRHTNIQTWDNTRWIEWAYEINRKYSIGEYLRDCLTDDIKRFRDADIIYSYTKYTAWYKNNIPYRPDVIPDYEDFYKKDMGVLFERSGYEPSWTSQDWLDWVSSIQGRIPSNVYDELVEHINYITNVLHIQYTKGYFEGFVESNIQDDILDLSEDGGKNFMDMIAAIKSDSELTDVSKLMNYSVSKEEFVDKIDQLTSNSAFLNKFPRKLVDLFKKGATKFVNAIPDVGLSGDGFSYTTLYQWGNGATVPSMEEIIDQATQGLGNIDTTTQTNDNMLDPVTIEIEHIDRWTQGVHRTKHVTAPDGFTQSELRAWATEQAKIYKNAGMQENFTGPFRPQLQVGDIAEFVRLQNGVPYEGVTIGFVTSVTHKFSSSSGYTTEFTADSGGIDSNDVEHRDDEIVVSGVSASLFNRKTRLLDINAELKESQTNTNVKVDVVNQRVNDTVSIAKTIRDHTASLQDQVNILNDTIMWMWKQVRPQSNNQGGGE